MSDLRVFEQMVAGNPDRMSLVDAQYVYREVNPTYLNDYQCRREDIIGKHIAEFIGQETFERIKPLFDSCLTGTPVRYQRWFDFKATGRRFMDVVYHPYREPDGSISGVVVTARDCTEQCIANEALAETKARLNLIAETIEDVVWFTDLDNRKVLFVSSAYERIWGHPVSCVYENSLDWIEAIHPEDRAKAHAAYQQIFITGTYDCEYRIIRPDGEVRWIHDRGFAVRDVPNRGRQLTGIAQDITARKELEDALRLEQDRLRAFLNNSNVIAWMKDAEGRYVFLSENFERRFNAKTKDGIGKTDFELWPQDIAEKLWRSDLEVLNQNCALEVIEKAVSANGSVSHWMSCKFPFRDRNGRPFVGGLSVDVTRRVQLEKALDAQQRTLRSFLDNSCVYAWMKDEAGRYVYLSDNFQKYLNTDALACVGKSDRDLLPHDIAEEYRRNDAIVLKENRPIEVVEKGVDPSGAATHWLCNKFPFQDETGSRYVGGLGVDISSRYQLEEALQVERRRLRAFLNNSLVAAFMKDEEGRYIFVNDMLLAHFGSRPEDWIGKTDAQIWPGPATERFRRNDLAVLHSGKPQENLERTVTRDGRAEWWLSNKFPFEDADGSRLIGGLSVNVTDRVLAEQERQKFVLLAEHSHEFIGICADDFVPIYVNPAGRLLVGLESLESTRNVKIADFFFPEDQSFITNEFLPRVVKEGHGEVEIRFRHFQTGEAIWMLYNVFRIVDTNDKSIGWGTVSLNITERRRAADALHTQEERLAHSQKLEAVGKLAAGMAHDVNSLFMVVSGNAEIIKSRMRRNRGQAAEQSNEALDRILNAVERGKALLNKLMMFGRVRVQKLGRVALNAVVEETMKLVASSLGTRVRVELRLAEDLRRCKSDASQLLQVVMNLILNANDAMPGGGTLTISTENVELSTADAAHHAEAQSGPHVLLSVRDTGVGMDAATLDRVLEPYFSTKPVDKGSGLGLSIVHAIVKQAGGHVTVASEVGKGSEFRVYLPAIR